MACSASFADNINGRNTVAAYSFTDASNNVILSTSAMTCSTTAVTYTAIKSIKWCEFQGVGVTIVGANPITATYIIQYSQADGTEKDGSEIEWHNVAAVAITESYSDVVDVYIPPSKLLRIQFTADTDGTANTYTVTHAVLTRY